MFAVIEDGSRQYRVQEGDTLVVDYRESSQPGDALTFAQVLLANAGGASAIGQPTIDGASVQAEVVDNLVKGDKIDVQKIRRRKNSRTHTGHRQKYTSVVIKSIDVPGLEIVETSAATVASAESPPAPDATADADPATETTEAETESAESSEAESASRTPPADEQEES